MPFASMMLSVLLCQSGEATPISGKIDSVTVYRGEALVTRVIEVSGEPGLHEVVVTDLPAEVQSGSIFAEADAGVSVRSIRYRVRPVAEDVREEVRELDKKLEDLMQQQHLLSAKQGVLKEDRNYLKQMETFVAPTANLELSKGVLNPETIAAVTKFMAEERMRLAQEEHEITIQMATLQQQLSVLQRERETLASSASKTLREAVVFVDMNQPGGSFRLRYLVNNATWSPSYNFRTTSEQKEVVTEFNASIQQSSGEDWNDVEMTLSTATPSLISKGPSLSALSVRLEALQVAEINQAPLQAESRRELVVELKKQEIARNKASQGEWYDDSRREEQSAVPIAGGANAPVQAPAPPPTSRMYDQSLNELAAKIQVLDLNFGNTKGDVPVSGRTPTDEGVSVTYTLPSRLSMPSRSDQQLVQIASSKMNGEFAKLATPILTEYVYDEVSIVNQTQTVLLAGPATSFVDGKFVGQGSIPTVAIGEKFTVGFGIDTSLRCRRETIHEDEKSQGGNRVLDFTYKIVVENFGTNPARVRILDRIPTAKESEVKISLTTDEDLLSVDGDYRAKERKNGILRWDVDVPAGAIGLKAAAVEYAFRMEFDKNMRVGGTALAN